MKKGLLRLAFLGICGVFFLFSALITIQIVTGGELSYPFEITGLRITVYTVTLCVWYVFYHLYRLLILAEQKQFGAKKILQHIISIRRGTLVASLAGLFAMPFFYRVAQLEDAPGMMLIGIGLAFIPVAFFVLMLTVEDLVENMVGRIEK